MTVAAPPNSEAAGQLPGEAAVLPLAAHENFPVALALVGRLTRAHLIAIYGFARLTDQVGDEAPGDRLALLDALEADLRRVFDGEPEHPLLRRLVPTVRSCALPREPFLRLIEANRRDQEIVAYATFDELLGYCALSANPVGELVLHIFGAASPERIALSDSVCTGLQLVEHWQDLAEDFRRGRVYLPEEDLARFGVTPAGPPEPAHAGAPRCASCSRSRSSARPRMLLDTGAPLVGAASRPRPACGRGLRGRRARKRGRDRRRRLRRPGRLLRARARASRAPGDPAHSYGAGR